MPKEKEIPKPLLMDKLTLPEKVMLGQTFLTPGFSVVIKLMEAACDESRIAINDVNPEDENYEQILKARQQYSRSINKFSALVLRSIEHHMEYGLAEEKQKELDAEVLIKAAQN